MSLDFVQPGTDEWKRMWDNLAHIAGDYADHCPETNEVWQYMGTTTRSMPGIGTAPLLIFVHQFRHRHRPMTARAWLEGYFGDYRGGRIYLDIAASMEWSGNWNGTYANKLVGVKFHCYPEELQLAYDEMQAAYPTGE